MAQQLTGLVMTAPRFDPQNEQVQIRFNAAEDGYATLVVFGPDGAWLLSLGEARVRAGANTVAWHGRDSDGGPVPDGIYTLELFGFDRARRPAAAAALRTEVEVCNYCDTAKRAEIHQRLARFRRSDVPPPRSNHLSVYAVS